MLPIFIKASETFRKFSADTSGTTGIEFGLIVSAIAIIAIPVIGSLGGDLSELSAKLQQILDEEARRHGIDV